MRTRKDFTRSVRPLLLSLSLLILSSCHGHGAHSALLRPALLPLSVGAPVLDTVLFGGLNQYSVSVKPGSTYKISLTGPTGDVDLLYFGTDGTFGTPGMCAVDNTSIIGVFPEDCIVTAPGSVLYFAADGSFLAYPSAAYTVDVEELSVTDLAVSTPLADLKNRQGAGVYRVPAAAGASYTAAMTGLDNDADLYVFADDSLSSKTTCTIDNTLYTGTTPEDCTFVAGNSSFYLVADPIFSSTPDVDFTVFAAPAPAVSSPADEGTAAAPMALSAGTPTVNQVGPTGTSYYSAPVGTVGSRYTVSVTGMTDNVNLTVYNNDATFTNAATCSPGNTFFSGTTAEDCTVTASGSTLYFKVTTSSTSGAAYLTLVSPGPP